MALSPDAKLNFSTHDTGFDVYFYDTAGNQSGAILQNIHSCTDSVSVYITVSTSGYIKGHVFLGLNVQDEDGYSYKKVDGTLSLMMKLCSGASWDATGSYLTYASDYSGWYIGASPYAGDYTGTANTYSITLSSYNQTVLSVPFTYTLHDTNLNPEYVNIVWNFKINVGGSFFSSSTAPETSKFLLTASVNGNIYPTV